MDPEQDEVRYREQVASEWRAGIHHRQAKIGNQRGQWMVSRAACQLGWLQWNRYEGPTPLGLNRVLRVNPNLSFDMHSLRRPFIFSN